MGGVGVGRGVWVEWGWGVGGAWCMGGVGVVYGWGGGGWVVCVVQVWVGGGAHTYVQVHTPSMYICTCMYCMECDNNNVPTYSTHICSAPLHL